MYKKFIEILSIKFNKPNGYKLKSSIKSNVIKAGIFQQKEKKRNNNKDHNMVSLSVCV